MCPIDGTLINTTTPIQSESGRNCIEAAHFILEISKTEASPLDSVAKIP